MTEKRPFLFDLKVGLYNSWDDPACYSVVNDCCKETHHRKATIHLLCCFPVVSFLIHYTTPGIFVRLLDMRQQEPSIQQMLRSHLVFQQ